MHAELLVQAGLLECRRRLREFTASRPGAKVGETRAEFHDVEERAHVVRRGTEEEIAQLRQDVRTEVSAGSDRGVDGGGESLDLRGQPPARGKVEQRHLNPRTGRRSVEEAGVATDDELAEVLCDGR
jgi:hypothetical protein